jgi:hypothetical protein
VASRPQNSRTDHVKILQNAGLISTRKAGHNYYYSLRREVIKHLLDNLWELAPSLRPVIDMHRDSTSKHRPRRQDWGEQSAVPWRRGVNDSEEDFVLTW